MDIKLCFTGICDNFKIFDINKLKKHFSKVDNNILILEQIQNYEYQNKNIACISLLHRSVLVYWPHNKHGIFSNEKLEFLGDSFINYFVAREAMFYFPNSQEGELSRVRAVIAGTENLAKKSELLGLDKAVITSKGDNIVELGETRKNILADLFEAVTAALLLDAGEKFTTEWLSKVLSPDFIENADLIDKLDIKSRFQHWVQNIIGVPPVYKIIGGESTLEYNDFIVACFISNTEIGRAKASNKRKASKLIAEELMLKVEQKLLTEADIKKYYIKK